MREAGWDWLLISADSDALGKVHPVAVLGEAGIDAHGAKDGGAGDLDGFGLLDDGIEDGVESGFAQGGETDGSGVAIERAYTLTICWVLRQLR